jgi:site-specific recombinase XerD
MMQAPFLTELERLGYTAATRKQMAAALEEFFGWLQAREISPEHLRQYYHYLSERPHKYHGGGLSSKTIDGHLWALRRYFAWLEDHGELARHPMSGLRFPKPQSETRPILTQLEVRQLYQHIGELPPVQRRKVKAILGVFYGCGLRRREGEQLNLTDVHFRRGLLYVRKGKGSKGRAIPMSAGVQVDLEEYAHQPRSQSADPLSFFLNRNGKRMSGQSFDRLLRKLITDAGIEKRITLHGLRHSIATHLLQQGLPLESVRDFLGHAHLETTQIYTRVGASPPAKHLTSDKPEPFRADLTPDNAVVQ